MPRVQRHSVVQPQDQTIRLIALTQNQSAIVDAADYGWLSQWNWYAFWSQKTQSFYACRNAQEDDPETGTIMMSHAILSKKHGVIIDHKNHNTLDNRRCNLRKATNAQNTANGRKRKNNTSGYRGVFKVGNRWRVRLTILIDGKSQQRHGGYFATPEAAAVAYNELAKRLHGDFAVLNDIPFA